jgi:hypothetical protein
MPGGIGFGNPSGKIAVAGGFFCPAGQRRQGHARRTRVGMGDFLGHFDRLSEHYRKDHRFETMLDGHGHGAGKKIPDLHETFLRKPGPEILGEAFGPAPGGEHHLVQAGCPRHRQRRADGGHIGVVGHGADDAGGAQDRNAANDPQPGVERVACQFFALGNLDDRLHDTRSSMRLHGLQRRLSDHLSRSRVDGWLPGRHLQPRLGDLAYPVAARNDDGGIGGGGPPIHPGGDFSPVGDVRIVTGILDDRADHRFIVDPLAGVDRNVQGVAVEQRHPDRRRRLAIEEKKQGRLGRRRSRGAGGKTAAQMLLPLAPHASTV